MTTNRPALTQRSARAIWDQQDAVNVKTLAEWRAWGRKQKGVRNDGRSAVAYYLRQHGGTAYILGGDDTVTRCEYRRSGLFMYKPVSIHVEG